MSRGISRGKKVIKFANASNRGRVCLFYKNETTISQSCKMYISSFGKICVITVCHEDINRRYCIQKSNNDHFHPYFDIIVLKMKGSSFIEYTNSTAISSIGNFLLRNHVTLILSHQSLSAGKDGGYRE